MKFGVYLAKSVKMSIRISEDVLNFIDELRKKNPHGGAYASRSETVRRIISDWAFHMTRPLDEALASLVVPEERWADVLRKKGYRVEKQS